MEKKNNFKLINLTPHNITLIWEKDSIIIESSGVARVEIEIERVKEVNWFKVERLKLKSTIGLPKEIPGALFIVSRVVAENNLKRKDLLMVWDTIRNDKGVIVGCKWFTIL